MHVALMAWDKPDHLEIRMANREAHLQYVADTGVVELAGPLLTEGGDMCGSLIVLNVPDMAAAQAWADNDPYAQAKLFQSVTLQPWKRAIG